MVSTHQCDDPITLCKKKLDKKHPKKSICPGNKSCFRLHFVSVKPGC
jgi:hypothetical protein